jgi:hypothetical protein
VDGTAFRASKLICANVTKAELSEPQLSSTRRHWGSLRRSLQAMAQYSYLPVNRVCVDIDEKFTVTCVFSTRTQTLRNRFSLSDGQKSNEAGEICAHILNLPYRQNKFLRYTRIWKLLHELGLTGEKMEARNCGRPIVLNLNAFENFFYWHSGGWSPIGSTWHCGH